MSIEDGDSEGLGSARKKGKSASADNAYLRRQARECAESHLRGYIKQVFDKADDLLFERSNSGAADASDYFNALRELRLRRQQVEQRFQAHFAEAYNKRLRGGPGVVPQSTNARENGLSLIDEKELEESLAIEGLIGKSKERFRTPLYALTQRYQLIVGGVTLDEDIHPLAPDVICHAFRDAFDGIELDVAIKLILYKLFEQHTLKELGTLYEAVNTLLIDAGILPQLKSVAPPRSESTGAAAAVGPAVAVPEPPSQMPPPHASRPMGEAQGDVYQTLQQLMNLRKFGAAPSPHETAGPALPFGETIGTGNAYGAGYVPMMGPPLPAADLVQGLSLLQHLPPLVVEAGTSGVAYIKSTLLQQLGETAAGKAIDPVHDNTIDVIGMIFEFILDEPSIPEVVKRLLNQLQIPILKVAIVDKEFFTQKQHPARRLLNTLGHASIGWNDKDEAAQRRRYEKMEYVVDRVLKEYATDPGLFAELLDGFTAFLAGEEDELIEDKLTEAAAEVAPVPSEQLAFEAMERRLDEIDLPRSVRDFLRGTWQRVLLHVAAQEGVEGETWKRRYQTLEDLLWTMEPKKTREDQRRMAALLPRLLMAIQDGMRGLACTQMEIDEILNALQPIHMACLRGEMPSEVLPAPGRGAAPASDEVADLIRSLQAMSPEESTSFDGLDDYGLKLKDSFGEAEGGDEAFAFDEREMLEDEFTEQAREFTIGTWVEFAQGDKKPRRVKLGWKSAVLGQYVFVDRRYRVVAEKTLHELAADLRSGRAQRVTNIGMFDRALDKVLNGLLAGAAR